jgi:hypothetical protein
MTRAKTLRQRSNMALPPYDLFNNKPTIPSQAGTNGDLLLALSARRSWIRYRSASTARSSTPQLWPGPAESSGSCSTSSQIHVGGATGGATACRFRAEPTVTEAFVQAKPLTVRFSLICKSAVSGQSAQSSAKVIENPPATKSDGGGSIEARVLTLLFSVGDCTASSLWQSLEIRPRRQLTSGSHEGEMEAGM